MFSPARIMRWLATRLRRRFPRFADVAIAQACRVVQRSTFTYRYHRRPQALAVTVAHYSGRPKSGGGASAAAVIGDSRGDDRLIDRLAASYRLRSESPTGAWAETVERHADIHAAILGDDRGRMQQILRDPGTSDLMYGFENNTRSLHRSRRLEDIHEPGLTLDAMICLAEAMGARAEDNPEAYMWRPARTGIDEVLGQIEAALGFEIPVPNPFPRECGCASARGIVSYRVPQALYQAWRIAQLAAGIPRPRVLEIGGGLGRTAFYARQFGIADYTIVDIPVSSLAQGNFLGRVLGEEEISLYGEAGATARQIKLLPPAAFLEGSERYDVVLNVDSLTEIGIAAARQYWSSIRAQAGVFLSINHEANDFTVAGLIKESGGVAPYSRSRYWLRRGYVEEVICFSGGEKNVSRPVSVLAGDTATSPEACTARQ
jgi:hypothetical protein